MATAFAEPVSAKLPGSRRTVDELTARARRLLATEISFVPHPSFTQPRAEAKLPPLPAIASDEAAVDVLPKNVRQMPAHLMRLCESPLLSFAEEQALFAHMNFQRFRAARLRAKLDPRRPCLETIEEIESRLGQAEHLRNVIVRANLRLAISNVKAMVDSQNSFDDLLSEGILAVMRAAENFDFGRGFRFSTYATRAIRRNTYRLLMQRQRDRRRFPSAPEDAIEVAEEPVSLFNEQRWQFLRTSLARLLRRLDPRERTIVRARFGLGPFDKAETLQKLAARLGVCKERVRQLEKRAIEKLQAMARESKLEAAGE